MGNMEDEALGIAKRALQGLGPESKAKGVPDDGSAEKGDDFVRTIPTQSQIEKALLKLKPEELADIVIELLSFMEINLQNTQSVFDSISVRLDFTEEESEEDNDKSSDAQPENG